MLVPWDHSLIDRLGRQGTWGKTKPFVSLLAQAVGDIGSLQVRNAGTIGGNLCTASPGADTAPPLLALDAEIEIKGSGTERTMPLTDFFLGPGQTKLNPDEILTEVQIPAMGSGEKYYWMKIGRRKSFTLSVISIAIRAKIHDGIFEAVRIALGVVSPTPIRIGRAEGFLVGKECSGRVIEEAAKIVAKEVCPRSSFRASAEYRRDMAQVLTKRGLTSCIG